MSTKELQELDQWIGVNVMKREPSIEYFASKDGGHSGALWDGDKRVIEEFIRWQQGLWECIRREYWPHYTTNKMDAMEVLEKCGEKTPVYICRTHDGTGWVVESYLMPHWTAGAETLPLAIARFAKNLFSNENNPQTD